MKDKDTKREESKQRQLKRNKRTVTQQIDKLDKKLGKGVGAKRERKRLLKK